MRKQEIINYNKVNLEQLSTEDHEAILNDYTEIEPYYFKGNLKFSWYKQTPNGWEEVPPHKQSKYSCTILASDGSMWQFGFNNRNRLRNKVKQIQSINANVIAKVIAIQEYYQEEKNEL